MAEIKVGKKRNVGQRTSPLQAFLPKRQVFSPKYGNANTMQKPSVRRKEKIRSST